MYESTKEVLSEKQSLGPEPIGDLLLLARRMRQSCEPMEKISSVTGLSREILKRHGVV